MRYDDIETLAKTNKEQAIIELKNRVRDGVLSVGNKWGAVCNLLSKDPLYAGQKPITVKMTCKGVHSHTRFVKETDQFLAGILKNKIIDSIKEIEPTRTTKQRLI